MIVDGPEDVEEVAVGPVVVLNQGPESDDQGIDFFISPKRHPLPGPLLQWRRGSCAHRFAEHGPFGRILEPLGGFAEVPMPCGPRHLVQFGEVALGVSQAGQFAFFSVGIETDGREMPVAVGPEVNISIQPVAPPAKIVESGEWMVESGRALTVDPAQ